MRAKGAVWAVLDSLPKWLLCAAITALLGAPLAITAISSFRGPADFLPFETGATWTVDNFTRFYGDPSLYGDVIPNTLLFAFGSLAVCYPVGLLVAVSLERHRPRSRTLLQLIVLLPLILPSPALALSWIRLLGPHSGLGNLALRAIFPGVGGSGPLNVFTMAGLIWCQGLASVPFAYLLLRPAVLSLSRSAEEAAFTCGTRPTRTFVRILGRQVLPGLLAPAILLVIILLELVEFPYIIGSAAQINVLGTRLLWEVNNPSGLPDLGAVAAASISLIAVSMCGLFLYHSFGRKAQAPTRTASSSGSGQRDPAWVVHLARGVLWWYVLVGACLPVCVLIGSSLDVGSTGEIRAGFQNFEALFGDDRIRTALLNTIVVAVGTAVLTTLIGVATGLVAFDNPSRFERTLASVTSASLAIPSLIVAAGSAATYLSLPVGIYGSVFILIAACSFRLAIPANMVRASLASLSPSLLEAAHVAGASPRKAHFRITIPLIAPVIASVFTLSLVASAREFTIPLMLYSPENVVLPVVMMQLYQAGNSGIASAATIALLLTTLLMLAATRLTVARLTRTAG